MSKSISSNRREFIKFLSYGSLTLSQLGLLQSCAQSKIKSSKFPSTKDDVVLIDGLEYYKIISWNDKMNSKEVFGFNNDYLNIQEISPNELIMWANHEYVHPLFVSGYERTKENIDIEKSLVGGSLIKLKKEKKKWKFIVNDKHNRGVRGDTLIPFANGIKVRGSQVVEGTLANCAGGKTPWNTFLTCEENYDGFYGERDRSSDTITHKSSRLNWHKHYPKNLPEHYGWVVEVDPYTGKAQKHTNLGRFAHESATCITSNSKKVVSYSGDDKNNEHLYKFVSKTGNNFKEGVLYVANIKKGKWLPLDLELSPILKEHFKTQLEVLTYPREAAKVLNATKLNRPEDIEIHPFTGDVFVALTNNKKKGDWHGSFLKISEKENDHASTEFTSATHLFGGEEAGFSCPDNMAFDKKGNLWFVTDISGGAIGKKPYKHFGNNGLFLIPHSGYQAGDIIQIGSAPNDAEFTGLCFDPTQETLFLSVQHPGERTTDLSQPTSNWPEKGKPKPTVIAIHGEFLNSFTQA
jgi:secreted PhoX family phosphatase